MMNYFNERQTREEFVRDLTRLIGLAGVFGLSACNDFRLFNRKHKKKRRGANPPDRPTEVPTDPTGQTGPHSIEGRIMDIVGRPFGNQQAVYNPNDPSVTRRSGTSDADGSYTIEDIPEVSSGLFVIDRTGFSIYREALRFFATSVNIRRDVRLVPEVQLIIGFDRPEYQDGETRRTSFLMYLKHVTGNRDGDALEGSADPFQAVESWPTHLESVNVTINTGDANLDLIIEESLNRVSVGAAMTKLDDQGNVVTIPIYQKVTSGSDNVGVRIVLGRNQGVSVAYDSILKDSIGANLELGLKEVSPYRSVVLKLADRIDIAELGREAERGLGWLALGPHARESVDEGHLLHDKTISLTRPYIGPDRLGHDELNVIQTYRSLPPGLNMANYQNR